MKKQNRSSRRSVLKGAVAGVAGVSALAGVAGAGFLISQQGQHAAHAAAVGIDSVQTIVNIASTAEQLGIVFYANALNNANALGLSGPARLDLKAAMIEEQLHLQLLLQQGAKPLTNTFSFPFGRATFFNFDFFIRTQQLLELHFAAAYLAAVNEFAILGQPGLAQIAAQIAAVELGHQVMGRAIGVLRPIDNLAFAPILLQTVGQAPAVLTKAGFLTPKLGNAFKFNAVSTNWSAVGMRAPTSTIHF